MPRVQAIPLLRRRIAAGAVAHTGTGLLLGTAARLARPWCDTHGLHWEALGSLVVLCGASAAAVLRHRRHPTRRALPSLLVEAVGLWGGFTTGWSLVEGRIWEDLVGVMAAWGAGSAIVAGLMLLAVHRWRKPVLYLGPYCPACDDHLIGLRDRRCPECGRAFTLEELGITQADLAPSAEHGASGSSAAGP